MRVISKSRLKQFWERPGHEDSEGPLRAWYTHVNNKSTAWQSWSEVRADFASASLVGTCVVFNIGGNKYRIVVWINYPYRVVYIRFIGTHDQYDRIDAQTI